MSKSVVSLGCSCFFHGRDFYVSPFCEEHGDWQEDDTEMCYTCGDLINIDWLDSKPVMTTWLKILKCLFGQKYMLRYAADHGYDFTRLECHSCYGKGFNVA